MPATPPPTVRLQFRCSPALRAALLAEAERRGVTINEVIALACSRLFRVPEYAVIPRKRTGRPPKRMG